MTVGQITSNTAENLYQQGRVLAEQDESARARALRMYAQPAPQEPEAAEPPGAFQGLKNVIEDFDLGTASQALSGFARSVAGDTMQGLRAAFAPGEMAANELMAGLTFGEQRDYQFGEEAVNTAKEIFRPDTGAVSGAAMDFAGQFTDDPLTKTGIAVGASVLMDPLTYVPLVGAAKAANEIRTSEKMVTAAIKGKPLSQSAAEMVGGKIPSENAETITRLARQADAGSKRAARKLFSIVDSESAAPLAKQWDKSTLNSDFRRVFSVRDRPTPKAIRREQAVLNYHRREGAPDLLVEELSKGPRYAPFRHTETYVNLNGAEGVQSMQNVYLADTRRYVTNSMEKATGMQKLRLQEELLKQPALLERQMGDKLNVVLDPVDAFAARRMLRDLGATARNQIDKHSFKFRSPIDRVRFWKMVLSRETLRGNLTGRPNREAAKALARINTEHGGSKAILVNKIGKATKLVPSPDSKVERQLGKAMGNLNKAHQVEFYLNNIFAKPGTLQIGHKYFMNSLLSNPVTISRNVNSNLAVALLRPLDETGASVIALSRGNSTDAIIHLRRARAMVTGYGEAGADIIKTIGKFGTVKADDMKMFNDMHEASSGRARMSKEALKNASPFQRAVHFVDGILPTEMLGLTDSYGKYFLYRADLRAGAAETASRLTKDPKVRKQITSNLVSDPMELQKAESFGVAEEYTFQNDLPDKWADMVAALKRFPPTWFVTPFIKTPFNIAMMGIRTTPFAPVSKKFRDDIKAGGTKRDVALAKIATTQLFGFSTMMALDDRVTGADSTYLRANQMPEYSIRIGNEWFSYKYLEPVRWALGPWVNLRDMAMHTDWEARGAMENFESAAAGTVMAYSTVVMDNFFMENYTRAAASVFYGLNDGHWGAFKSQVERIGAGFIPSGVGWVNRTFFDQHMRQLDGFQDQVKNRIPGLSPTLPMKVGLLGEPQTHPDQLLGIMPVDVTDASVHPLYKHIKATGAQVPDVAKVYKGAALDARQRALVKQYKANPDNMMPLGDAAVAMFDTPAYQQAGVEGKAQYIRKLIGQWNKLGVEQLYQTDPELREAAKTAAEQQRRLMRQ